MLQNGQTEPKRSFGLPDGVHQGGPESRKTLRGRGATKRQCRYLQRKYDKSTSCDDRETKFVRSKKASKTGKIELNEIFQPNKGVL